MNKLSGDNKKAMAVKLHEKLIEHIKEIRIRTLVLGGILKEIRDNELYRLLVVGNDADTSVTFEHYCCQPEISLKLNTANKYIRIYECLEENGIKIKDVQDIAINKLDLIGKTEKPKNWIGRARVLGYSDLKKEIDEKVFKVKPEDNEIKEHIESQEEAPEMVCPHWDARTGECKAGKL